MKTYSTDDTLAHLRQMPESLRFEEVLGMATAAPLAVGAGWSLAKLFAKWLHVKYLIPMFFTSTTAGLALWYGIQTFAPSSSTDGSAARLRSGEKNPEPKVVMLHRENPLNSESLRMDTIKKKKKIIREERRIMTTDGNDATAPLPPLPELPALAPARPGDPANTNEVEEERRVVRRVKKGSKDGDVEKADKDPFMDAMLDHLEKTGILKNREKFTLSLTSKELKVDDKVASSKHRDEVIELFHKMEKTKFGMGSSISISRDHKQWSVSKSIESD